MIPLIELLIDELEEKPGVFAISLVEDPAIESNFVALSKEKVQLRVTDKEKRIVTGLALRPDMEILRHDPEGNEYNIIFSKETVRKAAELYLKRYRQAETTYEHKSPVDGVVLFESWIVEDPKQDKTAYLGIDSKAGDWAISMKVDNEDMWEKVKAGEVLGFSIEGLFDQKKKVDEYEEMFNKLKEILKDG